MQDGSSDVLLNKSKIWAGIHFQKQHTQLNALQNKYTNTHHNLKLDF